MLSVMSVERVAKVGGGGCDPISRTNLVITFGKICASYVSL